MWGVGALCNNLVHSHMFDYIWILIIRHFGYLFRSSRYYYSAHVKSDLTIGIRAVPWRSCDYFKGTISIWQLLKIVSSFNDCWWVSHEFLDSFIILGYCSSCLFLCSSWSSSIVYHVHPFSRSKNLFIHVLILSRLSRFVFTVCFPIFCPNLFHCSLLQIVFIIPNRFVRICPILFGSDTKTHFTSLSLF